MIPPRDTPSTLLPVACALSLSMLLQTAIYGPRRGFYITDIFHACRSDRAVFLCWPLDERLCCLRQHRLVTFFTSMVFDLMFPLA